LGRFHGQCAIAASPRIVTLLRWQQRRRDIVDFAAADQQRRSALSARVTFRTKSIVENRARTEKALLQ
jgi:hypothetical protein